MKKSESITFRCNHEIKIKLEEIAEKEDRTLSYIINRIIENALKKTEVE